MYLEEMIERLKGLMQNPDDPLGKVISEAIRVEDLYDCLKYIGDVAKKHKSKVACGSDIEDWLLEHPNAGSPWRGIAILKMEGTPCHGCCNIELYSDTGSCMGPCASCSRFIRTDRYKEYDSLARKTFRETEDADYRDKLEVFLHDFEDHWDYLHMRFEPEKREDVEEENGAYPVHFSRVPSQKKEKRREFLIAALAAYSDMDPEEVRNNYTLRDAVEANKKWLFKKRST